MNTKTFTQEENEKFKKYELLKIAAKDLEDQMEELKPEILALIPEGVEVNGMSGKFFVQIRNSWKYSESVIRHEEALKALKKEEEAKGTAEANPKKILVYKEAAAKKEE